MGWAVSWKLIARILASSMMYQISASHISFFSCICPPPVVVVPKNFPPSRAARPAMAEPGGGGGPDLIASLRLLDPVLQFLTRATGRPMLPLSVVRGAVPGGGLPSGAGGEEDALAGAIGDLGRRGILRVAAGGGGEVLVGFHPRPGHFTGGGGAGDGTTAAAAPPSSLPTTTTTTLYGATKSGAKRRLAALRRSLKGKGGKGEGAGGKAGRAPSHNEAKDALASLQGVAGRNDEGGGEDGTRQAPGGKWEKRGCDRRGAPLSPPSPIPGPPPPLDPEEREALRCLKRVLGFDEKIVVLAEGEKEKKDAEETGSRAGPDAEIVTARRAGAEPWLPGQARYAGGVPARRVQYGVLSQRARQSIPPALTEALGLAPGGGGAPEDGGGGGRRLYRHQAEAVESILDGTHTLVCTGTGSGKSLCFLLPILASIINSDDDQSGSASSTSAALVMFPTKALAQDQMSKLTTLLRKHPALQRHVRPGVIDGDVPHADRASLARTCNLVLTNPDTLHAAILPNWKRTYGSLLSRVRFVVVDESHMYEGAFGAHVALVLARLVRVCAVACYHIPEQREGEGGGGGDGDDIGGGAAGRRPVFVACSATMGRPEEHFRLLCPVGKEEKLTVLAMEEDGSPCGTKHFFTWNPPLLDMGGKTTGRLIAPQGKHSKKNQLVEAVSPTSTSNRSSRDGPYGAPSSSGETQANNQRSAMHYRRHAADETARLLSEAVRNGIRCLAFCRTRSLVEWVYDRCLVNLRADPTSAALAGKVESYRGGYSANARRSIETRLFRNDLIGVVATSALELGVDIGGIDLTLHCGYPGSISSLMQQSGRAGRGGKTDAPSTAIMICFSSPSDQHFWRCPKSLLSRGIDSPPSIPINAGILHGHLLCAGFEYPLVGNENVTTLLRSGQDSDSLSDDVWVLSDKQLFGDYYEEVFEKAAFKNQLCESRITLRVGNPDEQVLCAFSTHPSVGKPWAQVSMRSIEPISYSIVNLNHNFQGGRTDTINERAVMDTIPYSRVFYHAHPGAIIKHRGRSYKIITMDSPPPFADCTIGYSRSCNLGAFAQPTNVSYSTRPLSLLHITVVKQFERVELQSQSREAESDEKSTNAIGEFGESCSSTDNILIQFPEQNSGTIAGNGVVTVKRTVHGYKKLSHVNRAELSRHELKMPSMEYDTNAIWFDVEADLLAPLMPDFDAGVHALSHALCAVAALFVPCTTSDIDCDHSHRECTRVLLFDQRAGGAGTVSRLWKHFFRPNGIVASAIELLQYCPTCSDDSGFKGGCPGCLQSCPCINFHEDVSRPAGLYLARRLARRLEQTHIFKKNAERLEEQRGASLATVSPPPGQATPDIHSKSESQSSSPRRTLRKRALRYAKDLESAKKRSVVVGRPTWPTDSRL